jgi:hypothetical protein
MARIDEYTLSQNATFQQRCISSIIDYIINTIYTECSYDLQTVSVSGSPTGGTFTLTGGPLGSNTVTLPWNATPSQAQVAINAALSPSAAFCVCMGTQLPGGSILVIWAGSLSDQPEGVMTPTSALTGGTSPTASVAHTVVGVANLAHPAHVALAKQIMASPLTYMPIYAQLLASNSQIQTDYIGGGSVQTAVTDAHIDAAVASQFNLWSGSY